MSGGCGSTGRHVTLEDLRVALRPGRGDATYLQEPGTAVIIALLFHCLSVFLYVQNRSDTVKLMSWFQALINSL